MIQELCRRHGSCCLKEKVFFMEKYLKIGVISSTHGLKGEVKVFPATDLERFEELTYVLLDTGREKKKLNVEGVRYFKNLDILRFREFQDISEVEKYRGHELWIAREDAQPLGKDEYYIGDLIGMTVVDERENPVGILKDVLQSGANDVYVIRRESGSELLLPAIHECILSVDIENSRMQVHLLKGMEE